MTSPMSPASPHVRRALPTLATIPPIDTFPGVDDLLQRADDLADRIGATRHVIGRARSGAEIPAYTVGAGATRVVVVGGVHPNEPIGFHSVLVLLGLLAERDPALPDATWHIVPCIDPDGVRLNESWFAAPADRGSYFRGFYRPAPAEQVEWSFPFDHEGVRFDAPIPETRALMSLLDEVRPHVFMGLHNAELGGVYYYLNRDEPDLVVDLGALPAQLGLFLDVGEPESAELDRLGPGVFRAPLTRERHDYLRGLGIDPSTETGGAGTADYLEPHGTLTVVAELPYWTHPDAADERGSGREYGDVLVTKAAALTELHDDLDDLWSRAAPYLRADTPFRRATDAFVPAMGALGAAEAARASDPAHRREATVAEVFGNEEVVTMFRLRFGGILRRALHAEAATPDADPAVRALAAEVEDRFAGWMDALAARPGIRPLPIERLVAVQLGALLVAVSRETERLA